MTDPAPEPAAWWGKPAEGKTARVALPDLPPQHGPVPSPASLDEHGPDEHGPDGHSPEWVPAGSLPDGRPRKPWGLGDALLGLGLALLLSTVAAAVVIAVLLVTGGGISATGTSADIFDQIEMALLSGPTQVAGLFGLWAGFMIAVLRASKSKGTGRLADDFGLRFDWPRDICIGLLAAAGLRAAEAGITWVLTQAGVDISGADNVSPLTSQTGFWLIVLVLCAGLGAPFFEELYFRGLLLRSLARRFSGPVSQPDPAGGLIKTGFRQAGNAVLRLSGVLRAPVFSSVLLSSLLFGMLHSQGSGASLVYIAAVTGSVGALLAVMAVKTGRLGPGICTHVVFNTSAVLLALWLA